MQTLRLSNSEDYPPAVIERVASSFDAAGVRQLMASRQVFVALDQGGWLLRQAWWAMQRGR